MDYNKKLSNIFNHYGTKAQLKQFQSEVYELIEAILEAENCVRYTINTSDFVEKYNNELRPHIVEEIADVQVMLNQFKIYCDIKDDEIKEVMYSKIDRQMKRIEDEIYERARHSKKDN